METEIEKIVISRDALNKRVKELAEKIAVDYEGKKLTMIGIMNGGLIFLADLIRHIPLAVKIDTIRVNTYVGDATYPKRNANLVDRIRLNVQNEHVLVVDDIIDTGKTLFETLLEIEKLEPLSTKICVLLNKQERRERGISPDYCCFDVENRFMVGYGLDYDDRYRNLPYVAVLKETYHR